MYTRKLSYREVSLLISYFPVQTEKASRKIYVGLYQIDLKSYQHMRAMYISNSVDKRTSLDDDSSPQHLEEGLVDI